jgi:hypothetical protein
MEKARRADALVVSAARYAYGPTVIVADERPRKAEVPLTSLGIALRASLGIALSAAAIWFVLLPAIREKPPSSHSCAVVVLGNGTMRCANGAPLATVVTKTKTKP